MVLALLASCGGDSSATSGGGATTVPVPVPVSVTPTTSAATFARVQTDVFTPSCATVGCHVGSAASGGLDLSAAVAYEQLIGVVPTNPNAKADGLKRVVAFKPDSSLLYHKLIFPAGHHASDYGNVMPTGTGGLTVGQVEYVRQWIAAGAPKTGTVADPILLADRTAQTALPFAPLIAPAPGAGIQLKVERFDVVPNFERELFTYRKLGNTAEMFVSRIETSMRPFSHHFLLYTMAPNTPALAVPQPNAVRDIRNPDGSMNVLNMLAMGYHVYFAGAMTPQSNYVFPAGMALRLPADAAFDLNVHYANHTTGTVPGEAYVNLYTVPASQVTRALSTLNLANNSFTLPAGQRTVIEKSFTFPAQTTIIALTSHMHARGERYQVMLVRPGQPDQMVYDNRDWEHPAMVTFATPLVLERGQGLKSVVTYNNTTAKAIGFGLTSDEEMDIIFGYYY
ncbi:MAG: hypothetical protein H0W67_04735 [Gemmatimonadales bacterium]|nr:hypothetical protein [Gemmatimonadales bacterium]